jgi:mRNA interferase MazF
MNRGEVWWYELPDEGARPGCILTRSAAIPVLNGVLVAPATRTVRDIPTQIHLDTEEGMPYSCALSIDNTLTVPKALLVERITTLGPAKLAELCAGIRTAVDC